MQTKSLRLRITGRPLDYRYTIEITGATDTILQLRESLQPFAEELFLTTAGVQSQISQGGVCEVRINRLDQASDDTQ